MEPPSWSAFYANAATTTFEDWMSAGLLLRSRRIVGRDSNPANPEFAPTSSNASDSAEALDYPASLGACGHASGLAVNVNCSCFLDVSFPFLSCSVRLGSRQFFC